MWTGPCLPCGPTHTSTARTSTSSRSGVNECPVKYRCAERSNGDTETVNGWNYRRFLRHKVQAKPRPPSTHALPESSVNPMSDEDIDRLDVDGISMAPAPGEQWSGQEASCLHCGTSSSGSAERTPIATRGVQAWQKEGQAPGRESDQGDTVPRVRGCRSGWFAKSAVLLSRVRLDRKASYQASVRGAGKANIPATTEVCKQCGEELEHPHMSRRKTSSVSCAHRLSAVSTDMDMRRLRRVWRNPNG